MSCICFRRGEGGFQKRRVARMSCTWTPKVCRIITFFRIWASILPTFGVLVFVLEGGREGLGFGIRE